MLDLTFLGMGATLGAGAYVLVGVIAQGKTGPSIILSFLISGLASILSALCYAEFGARVPKAGSAYVYSYVTVGEVLAWTTAWQLLLEYIIGGSSVARAWSGYVDSLAGKAISTWLNDRVGNWHITGLASYPDFLALGMTILLTLVCAMGVRESTRLNNFLTGVNVCVIGFAIIAGAFFCNTANFTPFAPFGISGIFTGAATAFYSYVGFDVIATSAEEARNPHRNIPIAIIGSLVICMACYMAVAAVVTLMVPYALIDTTAPLSQAFAAHGATWAKYIIAVGAVCGLSTSLMTSIFPMPRIVYAIASDGLLPAWIGAVHPRLGTPAVATIICGTLAGLLALIFDLNALADMMSIGTLLAYTLVAASVLVLRYRQHDDGTAAVLAGEMLTKDVPREGEDAPLLAAAGRADGSRGSVNDGSSSDAAGKAAAAASGAAGAGAVVGSDGRRPSIESPLLKGASAGSGAAVAAALEAAPLVGGAGATVVAAVTEHHDDHFTTPATEVVIDSRAGSAGLTLCGLHLLPSWSHGRSHAVRMWGRAGWSSYAAAAAQLGVFVFSLILASVGVAVLQTQTVSPAATYGFYAMIGLGLLGGLYAAAAMHVLPQARPGNLSFTTPLAPYLPLFSMAVNIYLLVSLSPFTWVRFAVWCIIGSAIYLFYGIKHSKAVVAVSAAVLPRTAAAAVAAAAAAGTGGDPAAEFARASAAGGAASAPLEYTR